MGGGQFRPSLSSRHDLKKIAVNGRLGSPAGAKTHLRGGSSHHKEVVEDTDSLKMRWEQFA